MNAELRATQLLNTLPDKQLMLLSVHVGPVQEFIAEARKMRDLWAGSYLLAKATVTAMKPIITRFSEDSILFPHIANSPFLCDAKGVSPAGNNNVLASLPNHFLAVVPEDSFDQLINEITSDVWNFLSVTGREVLDTVKDMTLSEAWEKQLAAHFTVMWCCAPVSKEDLLTDYQQHYVSIQRRMEEIKITRTFGQWNGGNENPKCGQCGKREIIAFPQTGNDKQLRDMLFGKLKKKENLCGVCLLKRLLPGGKQIPKPLFESTCDVAAAPFRKMLKEHGGTDAVKTYVNLLESLTFITISEINGIPGDMLYPEGLLPDNIEKERSIKLTDADKQTLILALQAHESLCESLQSAPSKYYAILMMDGDRIGKYLSGKMMPPGTEFSLDWQLEQSRQIAEIGHTAFPVIIEDNAGKTIYSGGDDLLAFAPLKGVLTMADSLQTAFVANVKTKTSAALVILHYQDSLRWGIEEARRALDRAKQDFNRNAVNITLKLASGSIFQGGYHWAVSTGSGNHSFLSNFVGTLISWRTGAERLGSGFVYDLLNELPACYHRPPHTGQNRFDKDIFSVEFDRLLKRHLPENSPLRAADASGRRKALADILAVMADPVEHNTDGYNFDEQKNLEHILKITEFLVREE